MFTWLKVGQGFSFALKSNPKGLPYIKKGRS